TYSVLHNGRKLGEMDVTYLQKGGRPLDHRVRTRGLPVGPKSLFVTWDFATKVDEMEITTDENIDRYELTSSYLTLRGCNKFENVGIMKQRRLWINETTTFNKLLLQEISISNSKSLWTYGGWNDQIKLEHGQAGPVDYWESSSPTEDGHIITGNQITTCGNPSAKQSGITVMNIRLAPASNNSWCSRAYVEWNNTAIPDNAVSIDQIIFRCDVHSATNARPCDITPLVNQPSAQGSPASVVWADIGDGTPFVANTTVLGAAGSNKTVNLGAAACGNMHANLGLNWWGFGIKFGNEARDGNNRIIQIKTKENGSANPPPKIEVDYTMPP
ncbi:MAG: hypothetical protein ACRD38_05505, partial [Nitrososphaerales archaeon]